MQREFTAVEGYIHGTGPVLSSVRDGAQLSPLASVGPHVTKHVNTITSSDLC